VKGPSSQTSCLCVVCSQEFSCAHQGEADIKRHILTKTHKNKPSSLRQQPTINIVPQNDPLTLSISRAEVIMTYLIVENNIPIAVL
jgi:hypothetical protein